MQWFFGPRTRPIMLSSNGALEPESMPMRPSEVFHFVNPFIASRRPMMLSWNLGFVAPQRGRGYPDRRFSSSQCRTRLTTVSVWNGLTMKSLPPTAIASSTSRRSFRAVRNTIGASRSG